MKNRLFVHVPLIQCRSRNSLEWTRFVSLLGMLEHSTDVCRRERTLATNIALALNSIAKRVSNLIERTCASAGPNTLMNETVVPRADIIHCGWTNTAKKKETRTTERTTRRLFRTCLLYGISFRVLDTIAFART